jgi:signal recognition particle subunit SRP54
MGPLDQLLGMIPGFNSSKMGPLEVDEKELNKVEAMINSMTPGERRNPSVIDASRKRRIAQGSGTTVQDINRLLKQFEQTRKMFKQFSDRSRGKGGIKFPFI